MLSMLWHKENIKGYDKVITEKQLKDTSGSWKGNFCRTFDLPETYKTEVSGKNNTLIPDQEITIKLEQFILKRSTLAFKQSMNFVP